MKQDFINEIGGNTKQCFFISPHLDDAALSCGALMAHLAKKMHVCVITIFTEASEKPYTYSAKAFLKQCRTNDAHQLFQIRRDEDKKALSEYGIQHIHLGFQDALWRKKETSEKIGRKFLDFVPEWRHVYPTYRWHVQKGRVSRFDEHCVIRVQEKINSIVGSSASCSVFAPLAMGSHVDHVLTNKVVSDLYSQAIFWSDFPYNIRERNHFEDVKNYVDAFEWTAGIEEKKKMILKYETQSRAMFPNGVPLMGEKYYFKRED